MTTTCFSCCFCKKKTTPTTTNQKQSCDIAYVVWFFKFFALLEIFYYFFLWMKIDFSWIKNYCLLFQNGTFHQFFIHLDFLNIMLHERGTIKPISKIKIFAVFSRIAHFLFFSALCKKFAILYIWSVRKDRNTYFNGRHVKASYAWLFDEYFFEIILIIGKGTVPTTQQSKILFQI